MKVLKGIDSGLWDQVKHDDYNIDKSPNSMINNEANSDKIEDLNSS